MRDILDKNKNVKDLIVDTTGFGYFAVGKEVPEIADLNAALEKGNLGHITVTVLTEVELPKAEAAYEISIKGLG